MFKIQINSNGKAYQTTNNKILKAPQRCGVSIGNLIGPIDSNGVLQFPFGFDAIDFSGMEDVGSYALYYKFIRLAGPAGPVSFPDLETVAGQYSMAFSFYQNTGVSMASFPSLTSVTGQYSMQSCFSGCNNLTGFSMPELVAVSGNNSMTGMFGSCQSLTSVSFPKLTTISGTSALSSMFGSCSNLENVSFPLLTTVLQSGLSSIFQSCTKLATMEFPELTEASGNSALSGCFGYCPNIETVRFTKLNDVSGASTFSSCFTNCVKLTDVYFNGLKTTSFGSNINQFSGMFNTSTGSISSSVNVHFPSNLSSTISGLTGYPNFGGTSGRIHLLFDLPATS